MTTTEARARPSPVLQPGRPADPAPPAQVDSGTKDQPEETRSSTPTPTDASTSPAVDEVEADLPEVEEAPEENQEALMARQSGRRLLLRQCERVLLLNFNTLAMADWPDNFSLASARRRRDLWLFSASLAAILFLAGIPGLVPAWIAGTGFGAFVLIVLAGLPFVRRLYNSQPSHLDLLLRRQRRMREARSHIQHLEGAEGLAWQCAMMAEFNPALKSTRFSALVNLSEKRILARELYRRDHIRLYLIYLLEAEKAYQRLHQAYFDGHQESIDNGWAPPEPEDNDARPSLETPQGAESTGAANGSPQVRAPR